MPCPPGVINWVSRARWKTCTFLHRNPTEPWYVNMICAIHGLATDWEDLLVPYLEEGGAESVGVVGTCFGSYIVMHTSASGVDFMKGGVSIHPAHPGRDYNSYSGLLLDLGLFKKSWPRLEKTRRSCTS